MYNQEPKLEEESCWETEFKKLGTYTNEYGYVHSIPKYDEIKDFILLTLAQQKEELLQEILSELPKEINAVDDYEGGYNWGIQKVGAIIKSHLSLE